jgi:hypothetical protein
MREPRSKLRFLVRQLVHNPIVQRPSTAVRSRFTQQADQQTAKTGNMAQNAQP